MLALSLLILMACGAGGSGVTVGKKIVLLLPETPTRFDTKDKPYFEAKVRQLCRDCQVLYSPATQDGAQQAQARTAITGGASVMALVASLFGKFSWA